MSLKTFPTKFPYGGRMTKKTTCLWRLGSLLALLACMNGCSYNVNLITTRNQYDAYLDAISNNTAHYNEQKAFYQLISKKTKDAQMAPYPELAAALQSMNNALGQMKSQQQKMEAAKPRYDRFAKNRATISSENNDDCAQFQAIQEGYQQLAQHM